MSLSSTYDNIFQNFKLYIEGVQIPFVSISINQAIGSLPQATIVVPPQAGLMDIARFYQPKVHIFFNERDTNTDKVLFTGIIIAATYAKSKEGNSGSMSISFTCAHRYSLITECLVDYCGAIRDGGIDVGGSNAAVGISGMANSPTAIAEALKGWTDIGTGTAPLEDYTDTTPLGPTTGGISRTDVLPSYLSGFASRLKGMPGVFINYWNQLTRDSFNPNLVNYQGAFKMMYKPLIEDGLGFFRRLTGHMLIENSINANRSAPCGPNGDMSILVPPSNQVFLRSAVQAYLAIKNLQTYLQNSNEVTNLYSMFQTFYQTMDYDILTLASPAEVEKDPTPPADPGNTYAVDTIIKPSMPFYYSPTCNILYPSMYTSINVNYDEISMPTRLDILNHEDGGFVNPYGTHFRTPASIRTAIAQKNIGTDVADLAHTTGPSRGAIGMYEMGRGVKYEANAMPDWLSSLFVSDKLNSTGSESTSEAPETGSFDADAITALQTGWNLRYPNQPEMNPWDPASNIQPQQRILFATADYYYTKKFASTKAGNINCLFNPYIIPGYPMDVLESSPNLPSFHGLCVAVSHNITASSVSTQVSFAAAMTYTELANYYIPFVNPYLEVVLGLAANPTLVNTDNGNALALANDFYNPTLGVTAVAPETLFDYNTGMARSLKMSNKILTGDGGNIADHSFETDLLNLCKRPIESKTDFSSRFLLTFIDLIPQNYTATGVKYEDPNIDSASSPKFEIGQSQFLDYSPEVYYQINNIQDPNAEQAPT